MKTLLSTLFIAGSFFLNGCGDNQETKENKEDITKIKNIGEALDYSLKFTALELYKQGQELDSLNEFYETMDKKSDTLVESLKKKYNF